VKLIAKRVRRRGRGQSLVEFAIMLPVMVVVILGLFDMGRAVFVYNTIDQAARQANRMAIVDQDASRVRATAIAAAATVGLTNSNVDVCFKRPDSAQLNCSSSTDNCPEATRVIGCLAIVRTHLNFAPLTPIVSVLVSSISLSSTSIEPIEYVCPEGTKTTCP
jgi:Flp pilus assembly protein TadG